MDNLTLPIWLLVLAMIVYVIDIVISIKYIKMKKHYDGVFRINTTDPEKDVYSLELNNILGDLENRKEIRLKVVNEGSQEKPLA